MYIYPGYPVACLQEMKIALPPSTALSLIVHVPILVHEVVHRITDTQYFCLGGFLEVPADEELIDNVVGLVKVEDDVKLANIAKVAIKHLHEEVNFLQSDELIVALIYAHDEIQRCVSN